MERTTGEVSRLLGVPEHRLVGLIRYRLMPVEIGLRAGRRVWTEEAVEAARRVLHERADANSMRARRESVR
jgi:DNA-binding transcriptional MerR regulator